MSGFVLEARAAGFAIDGKTILSDASFGLHAGELAVVLGPSGSGKSTLVKLLAGVRRPSAGEVLLDGEELVRLSGEVLARGIGYVPQDDIIHTGLRLRRALEYAARLRFPATAPPGAIRAAVDRVLAEIELADRAGVRIRKLSGGQRKRASLGTELLLAPRVLVLDEPTSGLDPDLEATTMALFRRLADQGRAVLTTSHATASLGLADLALVIVAGRLAWAGPVAAALEHFAVSDPDLVFKALRSAPAAEWQRRWRDSAVAARMAVRPAPVPVPSSPRRSPGAPA